MDFKKTALGIEFGSTRIKAVLIDENQSPVASGGYEWENKLEDGIWTYSMEDVHKGAQECFASLRNDVKEQFGVELSEVGSIGISGMMHGYLPFDKDGRQLAKFRTWRNTVTGEAAEKLTEYLNFNIPQRWSVAHLYQEYLNGENYIENIDFMTTLAGYIHWKLSGEKVMGVGEASGMFPIDSDNCDYDENMVAKFHELTGINIRDIFPKVLSAGEEAGYLTEEGARFLDPTGVLKAGIPLCPCEGDAGTGMVATNSVRVYTGNVSAGTSDFAMIVVDHQLGVYREVDMVTTPDGASVAMVHCNNCTTDINAWVNLFDEFGKLMGFEVDKGTLFTKLFESALKADYDAGGLISFNYYSGEGVTDFDEGRPLFVRRADAKFNLPNVMRMHLMSAMATLKIGMDLLIDNENVRIDKLYGHGGFFKTPEVGQRILSAAIGSPVTVMETAGEGGAYGVALLAGYLIWKTDGESLPDYLDNRVFAGSEGSTVLADKDEIDAYSAFIDSYIKAIPLERSAIENV